jgi:transcriptional regulator with XRE-family HTH domain
MQDEIADIAKRRAQSDREDARVEDYTDETSTFGDRLLLAREVMGIGQAQLADQMGIKVQTIRNWEEDRSEPRANKLQMLAGMLNVSMIWLMSGQGEPPGGQSGPAAGAAAQACLADLRSLRVEQMQLVEKMARLEKRLRAALG